MNEDQKKVASNLVYGAFLIGCFVFGWMWRAHQTKAPEPPALTKNIEGMAWAYAWKWRVRVEGRTEYNGNTATMWAGQELDFNTLPDALEWVRTKKDKRDIESIRRVRFKRLQLQEVEVKGE